MGSTTLIDIIGSMLIGGLLLVTALRMNDNATRNTFESQENVTVQQNLTSLVQTLEQDFRRIGYRQGGNPAPDSCVLYGRSDSVVFVGDMNDDGSMDTVTWYIKKTPIANCANPNARMLVRMDRNKGVTVVDSGNLGVTLFSIGYYNGFMEAIGTPFIFPAYPPPVLMQVSLMVQPTAAYDTAYSTNFAFWTETRLVSRNLTAR